MDDPLCDWRCLPTQHENAKKIEWIEKIDAVLSSIQSTWDSSIILTGETNIDLLSSSTALDMYEQMLDTYQFSCHLNKTARKCKMLIDHISSNISKNKILYSEILPCPTISDHDTPYIVIKLPTNKFEIRQKFIRKLKNLETFVKDFKTLLFTVVYSFDETEDQLVKTEFSRRPAHQMKDIKINNLQHKGDHLRSFTS